MRTVRGVAGDNMIRAIAHLAGTILDTLWPEPRDWYAEAKAAQAAEKTSAATPQRNTSPNPANPPAGLGHPQTPASDGSQQHDAHNGETVGGSETTTSGTAADQPPYGDRELSAILTDAAHYADYTAALMTLWGDYILADQASTHANEFLDTAAQMRAIETGTLQ